MYGKSKYYYDVNRNLPYDKFKKKKGKGREKILNANYIVIADSIFCYQCQNCISRANKNLN